MKKRVIKKRYRFLIAVLIIVSLLLIFALALYPYSELIKELAIPSEAMLPLLIFFALLPISLILLLITTKSKKK